MIAAAIKPPPDLRFGPESVPVEGGLAGEADNASTRATARLAFSPTPLRPLLGLAPNGGAVRFTEHAFSRLVDARIAEVWSLPDRAAVEAQLGGERRRIMQRAPSRACGRRWSCAAGSDDGVSGRGRTEAPGPAPRGPMVPPFLAPLSSSLR